MATATTSPHRITVSHVIYVTSISTFKAYSPGCELMISGRLTRATIHALDWLASKTLPARETPSHQLTGRRGEEHAYFYLRRLGYLIIARNFRSPHRRGEIDLIGWDKDVLCFIEVKTRTSLDVKPAEAAVDRDKQRELAGMAREYLRHMPSSCQWRFDVVSIYYTQGANQPRFELFRNAFALS
jgi:putative endonuclease